MNKKHAAKQNPEEPYAVMPARTDSVGALGEQSPKATRSSSPAESNVGIKRQ